MNLSKEEHAMIQAFRKGAKIEVTFYRCKTPEEAIKGINIFGKVDEITDLTNDYKHDASPSFIAFQKNTEKGTRVRSFFETNRSEEK